MTLADRQGCPGVLDLGGAGIEQRMGMGHRDFGLVLNLAVRVGRLEDQQALLLFEANPGRPLPLLRKEALDVMQPAHLAPDQAGEGRGEEKAAANSHETQGLYGIEMPFIRIWQRKGEATLHYALWFPLSCRP